MKLRIKYFFSEVIQRFPGDFFKNVYESFYHGLLFYVLWDKLSKDRYEVLPEFQVTNGQVDVMARTFEGAKVYAHFNDLFELKQVPKSASDTEFETKFREAKSDIKKYRTGPFADWRGVAVCFRGNKDYKIEVIE